MAHPCGPYKSSNSTCCVCRTENLASLSSEVRFLRLQALNLPITGSKAQLTKCLQATIQGIQHCQPKPTGCAQKHKSKSHAVRAHPMDRTDNNSRPALDIDDRDELSSLSSLDLYKDPPNVDTLANLLRHLQPHKLPLSARLCNSLWPKYSATLQAISAIPRFWGCIIQLPCA